MRIRLRVYDSYVIARHLVRLDEEDQWVAVRRHFDVDSSEESKPFDRDHAPCNQCNHCNHVSFSCRGSAAIKPNSSDGGDGDASARATVLLLWTDGGIDLEIPGIKVRTHETPYADARPRERGSPEGCRSPGT